jgi:hypothetical protein
MALTTATLSGPTSGLCGVVSTGFAVTLDDVAPPGGVVVTVADTGGGDTITASPFTIAAGNTTGAFTITPGTTCGNRDVSITTAPVLAIAGNPITYAADCACPDDAGANSRTQNWSTDNLTCGATFSLAVSTTPSTVWARDLYCQDTILRMTFTE